MPDIVQLLEMLQSQNPDKRFDACEELRVAQSIPEEALTALQKATHDPDRDVADAAVRALAAHNPSAPGKAVNDKAPKKESPLLKRNRAKAPYSWLRVSPLLTGFTFILFSAIGNAIPNLNNFYIVTFGAILISALWHLLLLQHARNPDSEFVRWHGRQALLLAGIRTLTCLVFLVLDAASGGRGAVFYWVIPVLIAMWLIMTPWGNRQVERGECALANWMGHPIEPQEENMDEGDEGLRPKKETQAQNDKAAVSLPAETRRVLLVEINRWEKEGLVQPAQAEALRQRYKIEAPPRPAAVTVTPQPAPTPAKPATVLQEAKPAAPAKPQLTLTERLLSQTSINIFLYLGAFLVIGSAVILAALVEAARLPVLLAATLIFGVGAGVIKKRLPQPSITLFVVFSCLLPIDANVLAQNIHINGTTANAYWAVIYFSMAFIWGLATWFYSSRIFSVLAFGALGLALLRFSEIFYHTLEWNAASAAVSALLGLLGVQVLKDWKDNKFAQPLFFAAQAVQALALLASFWFVSYNLLIAAGGATVTDVQGFASAFTWISAAAFYAWSELLFPFALLPWAATGSMLPLSWLVLKSFNASDPAQVTGLFVWGALLAFASEYFVRRDPPRAREYYLPLLLGSVPVLTGAALWGLNENISHGFACLVGIAIVYTLLMIVRPRQLVWAGALLAGLAGYFTFYHLPSMQNANVLQQYQLLGAALLLTVPELFFRSELSYRKAWRWPPFLFGILIIIFNINSAISYLYSGAIEGTANAIAGSTSGQIVAAAIVFGVYALLCAAYAFHLHRPRIGYFATAAAALAVVFALQHFNLDQWLPVLSGLALVYFIAGYFLRGGQAAWGGMLRISSLALGALISFIALVSLKAGSGWYVLLTGGLFMLEIYIRPEDRLEAAGPVFFSAGAFLILRDLHIDSLTYNLLTISLIWLAADLLYARTLKQRRTAQLTRFTGGGVAVLNAIVMVSPALVNAMGLTITSETKQPAIAFGIYAVFFAIQAGIYQKPRLGYAGTGSLALSIAFALQYFQRDLWLPVLTGLALAYYAAGYFLRAKKTPDWGGMLRISGLAVGALVSLFALNTFKHTGGWYALVIGVLWMVEIYLGPNDLLEIGGLILINIAAFLILHDLKVNDFPYHLLAYSLIWLGADGIFARTLKQRRLAVITRLIGGSLAFGNAVALISPLVGPKTASVCFGVYAVFFALYAWAHRKPVLGYAATASLPLSVFFLLRVLNQDNWLYEIAGLAVIYYAAGYFLRLGEKGRDWGQLLLLSGLGLGVINSGSAVLQVGLDAAIPVAMAATLFAAEAFARRNVWLGFPANVLYLEAYFLLLFWLNVSQPQFFSVGTAMLGMLMHYLLTRAGSKTGAFLTGMFSQLVLLGTTYIQMYSTQQLSFFVVIFLEALAVLAYGIVARSRSLIIAPILFIVISVFTVLYTALKGISTVILIGGTGLILLLFGISAVVLRERITKISERLSGWNA